MITGCSSGIGYCVAKELQARGYDVVASARNSADVDRLHSEGLKSVLLDLDSPQSIQSGLAQTLEHTQGTLYALFNNGAYGQPGAVEDLSRDVLRQQFETNVFGWIELTNLIIPIMRKQGYGRLIQNSSVLGLVALKFRGAYIASKFAIEGFSDTLRLAMEGSDIFVSLIEPGPIESKFRANGLKAFQKNINRSRSFFEAEYVKTEQRLLRKGVVAPFTKPPSAVTRKVIRALESKKPKPRYYVTFPTYLFTSLKRILTDRKLDKILLRVSR